MAVTNKRGIFALLDVRERQATGVWSVKPDVWLSPSPYFGPRPQTGYFGGGTGDPAFSDVDRIDYSNDTATASPKGPLSAVGRGGSGTGNSSFGYFGGGLPGPRSTVDRIDYSNDTATASLKGPLNEAVYGNAACSPVANGL
jgi:hypothetical protein